MERVILHCDCNAFFASVETISHPEYARVPMAVCGDPKTRRGIVLAKNELAKRRGVKTAETIREAKRKCPELLLVAPHYERYAELSEQIFCYYQSFTDQVEPFGSDEAWLDVTHSRALFGSGETIADTIREGVKERFGITVSVGVSFNKTFAKLASDYKKPDATTVFSPADWKEKIFPLPVEDLLFVGHSAKEKLHRFGITTIGRLAAADPEFLKSVFGKTGAELHARANGIDDSAVRVYGDLDKPKSIGNSFTFPRDLESEEDLHVGLRALADKVASRLRRHGAKGAIVTLTVRTPDLKTVTRQAALADPTDLSDELFDAALELLIRHFKPGVPIRLLGISASRLSFANEPCEQLSLFESETQKRKKLFQKETAVDRVRARFGKSALLRGVILQNDLGVN